jgi:hypothetical protein
MALATEEAQLAVAVGAPVVLEDRVPLVVFFGNICCPAWRYCQTVEDGTCARPTSGGCGDEWRAC